jgi:hypothetical protein
VPGGRRPFQKYVCSRLVAWRDISHHADCAPFLHKNPANRPMSSPLGTGGLDPYSYVPMLPVTRLFAAVGKARSQRGALRLIFDQMPEVPCSQPL